MIHVSNLVGGIFLCAFVALCVYIAVMYASKQTNNTCVLDQPSNTKQYCSDIDDQGACTSCDTCGWCISENGRGRCVRGSRRGPRRLSNSRSCAEYWYNGRCRWGCQSDTRGDVVQNEWWWWPSLFSTSKQRTTVVIKPPRVWNNLGRTVDTDIEEEDV